MSIPLGCLTPNQRLIWGLKNSGAKEAHIARQLDVTRQTIHKIVGVANIRVERSLKEAAEQNKIDVLAVNAARGFLSGYSPHFKTEAFVTFSAKNGIQVWYRHEGNCQTCSRCAVCRQTLVNEAAERHYKLAEDEVAEAPSRMAEKLFAKIMGETKNVA